MLNWVTSPKYQVTKKTRMKTGTTGMMRRGKRKRKKRKKLTVLQVLTLAPLYSAPDRPSSYPQGLRVEHGEVGPLPQVT